MKPLLLRVTAIAAVAVLSIGAGGSGNPNWSGVVNEGAGGSHVMGNPQAKVKLTEYVSYTCSHCATFHKSSYDALRMAYVMPGKVSINVQHLIRDPIDLTATLLANCGAPKDFFKRHNSLLYTQDKWLPKIEKMSNAQKARWQTGTTKARLQAIAGDFGFYALMASHGLSRAAADQCLGDEGLSRKLLEQTRQASEFGVQGTPSFAIDGELLEGTHDWDGLRTQLQARLP